MRGRPRTLSDDAVLEGAVRALSRVGPARLTLAEVGREVGLSPATLVQRFGSKRGLLLALAASGEGAARTAFTRAREAAAAAGRPYLDALVGVLVDGVRPLATPEALANHLAVLHLDLTEAEFHAHALAHARAQRAGVRALLAAAVEAGELRGVEGARGLEALARAVHTAYQGSLVTWALLREGALAAWLRRDLEAALAPHRAVESKAKARGSARGARTGGRRKLG